MAIVSNGAFDLQALAPALQKVVFAAAENATVARARQIETTHLLAALLGCTGEAEEEVLQAGLLPGVRLRDVDSFLRAATRPRDATQASSFTGALDEFSLAAQRCLAHLDQMAAGQIEGVRAVGTQALTLAHLWSAVLAYPEPDDAKDLAALFDSDKLAAGFAGLLDEVSEAGLPPLYSDDADELLLLERFDELAIDALRRAIEKAGALGYEKLMPVHIAIALFSRADGVGEWCIRRQAKPGVGPAKVVAEIEGNIALGYSGQPRGLELSRGCLAIPAQRSLEAAVRKAAARGKPVVDEACLLYGVLVQEVGGRLEAVFRLPSLEIDRERMRRHLDRFMKDAGAGKETVQDAPLLLPRTAARSEDLTFLARGNRLPPVVPLRGSGEALAPIEQIRRGLHKRENNHILITGPEGVGKTTLVRELALQMAAGEIGFLANKKLVWVDCSDFPAEESRARLEEIITAVKGRNDVIVCLDNLEAAIRYAGQRESNNVPQLKNALRNHHLHLIGILSDRHFNELLASEYQFLKLFSRVEVPEPDASVTQEILRALKDGLEKRFGLVIEDEAIQRAAILARDFIMSERLPTTAIEVLHEGCELVRYTAEAERRGGAPTLGEQARLTAEHIVEAVAQKTAIARSTLRGSGETLDFEKVLAEQVVGQKTAVRAVATEMKLIRAGSKETTKPASIMLFAGLTGVGKSEMAKALAQIYSASKKLTVYAMGNFNDSHTVSGIIGSPQGYHGYDKGGRLINDLNADPYSVVLLDEVEKAHPDIWKPFLNLFDEGWIVDQRNVRAYGNRAIFILTSNAGADLIAAMAAQGKSHEEMVAAVKQVMFKIKHPTSQLTCFPPEFLARITKVIIFEPLTLEAMREITRLKLTKLVEQWREKRGKTLRLAPKVCSYIAELGNQDNLASGHREGARIIAKHIASIVEAPLTEAMAAQTEAYLAASEVRLALDDAGLATIEFASPPAAEAASR